MTGKNLACENCTCSRSSARIMTYVLRVADDPKQVCVCATAKVGPEAVQRIRHGEAHAAVHDIHIGKLRRVFSPGG